MMKSSISKTSNGIEDLGVIIRVVSSAGDETEGRTLGSTLVGLGKAGDADSHVGLEAAVLDVLEDAHLLGDRLVLDEAGAEGRKEEGRVVVVARDVKEAVEERVLVAAAGAEVVGVGAERGDGAADAVVVLERVDGDAGASQR